MTLQRIKTIAKVTINPLQAGYRSSNSLNTNFDAIEAALENTISRDGTAPNQMEAEFDLNDYRIINIAAPVDDNDAVRKIDIAALDTVVAQAESTLVQAEAAADAAIAAQVAAELAETHAETAEVAAEAAQAAAEAARDEAQTAVTFTQNGTGAIDRSYLSKLQDVVNAADYGVSAAASATSNTAAFLAAFNYSIANKKQLVLKGGIYNINGPICQQTSFTNGSLNLYIDGDVTLEVDAASTPITYLIACITTALNPHTITGGRLTINCNNKVQRVLTLDSGNGGTVAGAYVLSTAEIVINDVYAGSGSGGGAYAFNIVGPFKRVLVSNLCVDGVSRHADYDATGDCKGLRITQARGPVRCHNLDIRNVLNELQDADGIFISGVIEGGVPICPLGVVTDSYFENCQGRSIKTQCAHTEVHRTKFFRSGITSITQGHDIDAQYGSLNVRDWDAEYRIDTVDPIGTSFIPFMVQGLYGDAPKNSCIGPGRLVTEQVMPNLTYLKLGASSAPHFFEIDGPIISNVGALTTTVFDRGLMEFAANEVKATSNPVTISVKNTVAPNTVYLIAYTGGDGTDLEGKLRIQAHNNRSTLTTTGNTVVLREQSGTRFTNLSLASLSNNIGYWQVFSGNLDFTTLPVDNDIQIDLAATTITNGPASGVPASGYASVRTGTGEETWFNFKPRELIIHSTGQRFYSEDGTWFEDFPMKQAAAQANSTAVALADLVTDFNSLLAKLRTAEILDT